MTPLLVYREDPFIILDTSNGSGLAFQVYRQTSPPAPDGSMEYERLPAGEITIYKTLEFAKAAIKNGDFNN